MLLTRKIIPSPPIIKVTGEKKGWESVKTSPHGDGDVLIFMHSRDWQKAPDHLISLTNFGASWWWWESTCVAKGKCDPWALLHWKAMCLCIDGYCVCVHLPYNWVRMFDPGFEISIHITKSETPVMAHIAVLYWHFTFCSLDAQPRVNRF